MQYGKKDLQRKEISLHANLLNMKRFLEGVRFDLVKLEIKLKETR
jgi:hypothetical protein